MFQDKIRHRSTFAWPSLDLFVVIILVVSMMSVKIGAPAYLKKVLRK